MRAAVGDAEAFDSGADSRLHFAAGARVECGGTDERAIRDPARHGVRAGGEPARVAHCSVREQGDGRAAGESGSAIDDRAQIARLETSVHRNERSERNRGGKFLRGEVAGFSVQQIPRCRYDSRAGNALDRRGDGHCLHVRAGICEGAACREPAVAAGGHGFYQRERPRQASSGFCGSGPDGGGIESSRHAGDRCSAG